MQQLIEQNRKAGKIQEFIKASGNDSEITAYEYLEAEEWDVESALCSYKGDKKHEKNKKE
jgi:hypothetical protein